MSGLGAPPVSFATTPEQRIRELRHDAVRRSLRLLRAGDSAAAHALMRSSVELQALLVGVHIELPSWESS